ncbi:hypothetical protein DOY81_004355 [Sarcophaga bullata]|nr:hypothetical protein DOY81_004355 [Sarcophaga bullata]
MDIGELLSFKPESTPKRPHEDDDDYGGSPERSALRQDEKSKRMKRIAQAKENADFAKPEPPQLPSAVSFLMDPELTEEERLNILKYVENEEAEGDVLDDQGLKKLLLVFEKKNLKNQELRIKYPDNPVKFMDSELELHGMIQELKAIATVPDLYPVLVELNGIPSLLELLSHPNTDIAVAIVDLLQEVTDVDILGESSEGAEVLIEALRKQQVTALLVQNLDRLNEQVKEEADGVHNTLSIIENLTEMNNDIVREAAEQGLLNWILKRLKQKPPYDANKLYCSEILSILIQTNNDNRLLLGDIDGIDILLQQLAFYKKHDPASTEEQEYMENLFNCMCSALMAKENRERFLKGEGLQLMNLMLREKKMSRNGALKVLDHALTGPDGKENCNKFVDILGLRTIFPLFMKTPKKNKRLLSADAHEEHVCAIIASMLRNCKGAQRQRLLSKFTENDHEKVDRLLELHLKYLEKVEAIDREIDQQQKDPDADEDEETENNYMKRLTGGLFTLQMIDYIILEISSTTESIKQRVVQILNLRGASMKTIRSVMREYAGNLGDDGDADWKEQDQTHILSLVDRF